MMRCTPSGVFENWGRTGFDVVVEAYVACGGADGHLKIGKTTVANNNVETFEPMMAAA